MKIEKSTERQMNFLDKQVSVLAYYVATWFFPLNQLCCSSRYCLSAVR